MSNTMLDAMAGFLPYAARMPAAMLHSPKTYFTLGVMFTLLAQMIGYYLARIVLRFRS